MRIIGNQNNIPSFSSTDIIEKTVNKTVNLYKAVANDNKYTIEPGGYIEIKLLLNKEDSINSSYINIKGLTNEVKTMDTKYKNKLLICEITARDLDNLIEECSVSFIEENIDLAIQSGSFDFSKEIIFRLKNNSSENKTITNFAVYRSMSETETYITENNISSYITKFEIKDSDPSLSELSTYDDGRCWVVWA